MLLKKYKKIPAEVIRWSGVFDHTSQPASRIQESNRTMPAMYVGRYPDTFSILKNVRG